MKVFIRRDTSDLHSRFLVFDEYGNKIYSVSGRNTASGELMKVIDAGFTAAKIRDMKFPVINAYSITVGTESVKLFFTYRAGRLRARYSGISWRIRGDILSGSFDILDADGTIICSVCERFSDNCTELNIYEKGRELFCIASAVCVNSMNFERVPDLQLT